MFKNLIDFSRVFHRDKTETTLVFVLVILIALGLIFWFAYYLASPHLEGYLAVFLSNNQVYFGKVSYPTHRYVKLTDIYYLQLKHQVANRIQSRARGPIQLLTRQPTEGRAKEGGLRLGEMEKDTFVAHGASMLLKERFNSDETLVPICEKCGSIAIHDGRKDRSYCPLCGENTKISNVEISYAFKLFLDETKSLMLNPMLRLKTKY